MSANDLLVIIIFAIAIFLFLIVIGNNLITLMVDEQIRYLRLIVSYTPVPPAGTPRDLPEPVLRYLQWAQTGEKMPVECVHLRHAGRIRYGRNGGWKSISGEAIFSLAVPGFAWHAIIQFIPGIWIDAFDYYVHEEAGTNHNLFSFLPLNNTRDASIKPSSLVRYLACTPLFPLVHEHNDHIHWEPVDDSLARAVIRFHDVAAHALVRFDDRGWIESIRTVPGHDGEPGDRTSGHVVSRFSSYTVMNGFRIPLQIESEYVLPDGETVVAEYTITSVEYDAAAAGSGGVPP